MIKLIPTSDRKTRKYKGQYNCYGLLPGIEGSCPGATLGEGGCCHVKPGRKLPVCYVMKLMKAYPGVHRVLEHNTRALKNASKAEQQAMLEAEFNRFLVDETKHANKHVEKEWLHYRLHWSGDFFDESYAEAAAKAMRNYPQIHFWTYTRSLFAVPTLADVPNLSLYISLDPINIVDGLDRYYARKVGYPSLSNVQICYLSPTEVNDFDAQWARARELTTLQELWDDKPPALSTCPVDAGTLPLENGCSKCRKCLGTLPLKQQAKPGSGSLHPYQNLRPIWFKP